MKDYIFVLGRDYSLSMLEIASFLKSRKLNAKIKESNKNYAVVSGDIDAGYVMRKLGGTLKIAEVADDLNYVYKGKKNKITYSINIFTDNEDLINETEEELKNIFRQQKLKALYKKNLESRPSRSASIDAEFVIAGDKVGKVVAVSNPKEYISRDEIRPHFDAATVISLRLARILINLSGVKEGQTLVDPFCGLGTIMQEALLMGVKTIGVDNNAGVIKNARDNLEWIGKDYSNKWKLIKADASKLSSYIKNADAAVTEPYMGPYVKKVFNYEEALKLKSELERLYLNVLKELRKIVKGKVVFVFPRFKTKKGRVKLNVDFILKKTGFKPYSCLKEIEMPILYFHKRSVVERLIYVLE